MRHAELRRRHLFIGFGALEASYRLVIAGRLKCSGGFWTVKGASAIIALRCAQRSNRIDGYWKGRTVA